MKTKLVTCILLPAAILAVGVRAQTVQTASPAPAAPTVAPAVALAPNQTVYAQRLPSVNELTNIATAQGLAIERIEQSAAQVTVVYRYANGQTNTVAYLLLPGVAATSTPVVATTTPPPAVVYEAAPRIVYYDGYGPYYPYPGYWYPPVSIALGFGYRGGFYGGYHGGFRHR